MLDRLHADLISLVLPHLTLASFFHLRETCRRFRRLLDHKAYVKRFPTVVRRTTVGWMNVYSETGLAHGSSSEAWRRYFHGTKHDENEFCYGHLISGLYWGAFRFARSGSELKLQSYGDNGWSFLYTFLPSPIGPGGVLEIRDRARRVRTRMDVDLLGHPCGEYRAWYLSGQLKRFGHYRLWLRGDRPHLLADYDSERTGTWFFYQKDGRTTVREYP